MLYLTESLFFTSWQLVSFSTLQQPFFLSLLSRMGGTYRFTAPGEEEEVVRDERAYTYYVGGGGSSLGDEEVVLRDY